MWRAQNLGYTDYEGQGTGYSLSTHTIRGTGNTTNGTHHTNQLIGERVK